jgi:hypothetical protein
VPNLKSVAIAAVSCALVAGSLSAQTGVGQVKWAGVNGAWSSYRNASQTKTWNVYTSPYKAQFKIPLNDPASVLLPPSGTTSFGPVSDIFCVDFNHSANTGTYNAKFYNLGTSTAAADIAAGTYTRSGHTLQQYLATAYLSEQIKVVGVNTAAAKDMNGAIWQIMSGEPTFRWNGSTWDNAGITSWFNLALGTGYASVNASNWVVVTDVASVGQGPGATTGGSQEYITQVTPEPATLILLGTGLLGLLLASGAIRRPLA